MITPQDMLQYGQHFSKEALDEYNRTGDPGVLTGRGRSLSRAGLRRRPKMSGCCRRPSSTSMGQWKELPEAPGVVASTSEVTDEANLRAGADGAWATREGVHRAGYRRCWRKAALTTWRTVAGCARYCNSKRILKQIDEANFGTGATARNMVNKTLEALGGKKLDSTAGIGTAAAELGRLMLGGELETAVSCDRHGYQDHAWHPWLGGYDEAQPRTDYGRLAGLGCQRDASCTRSSWKNVELPEKMSQREVHGTVCAELPLGPRNRRCRECLNRLLGLDPRPARLALIRPAPTPSAGMSDESSVIDPKSRSFSNVVERQKQGR